MMGVVRAGPWRVVCPRSGRRSAASLPYLRLRSRFFSGLPLEQSDLLDAGGVRWTPCSYVRVVLKGVMDDAALVGVHRLKLKGPARRTHALRQLPHPLDNLIFAHGAIMFAIHHHLGGILILR